MTQKEKMINDLMIGNTYAHPQNVIKQLKKRTTDTIAFYYNLYKGAGLDNSTIIDFIIKIG